MLYCGDPEYALWCEHPVDVLWCDHPEDVRTFLDAAMTDRVAHAFNLKPAFDVWLFYTSFPTFFFGLEYQRSM